MASFSQIFKAELSDMSVKRDLMTYQLTAKCVSWFGKKNIIVP